MGSMVAAGGDIGSRILRGFDHAMQNPFGVDFRVEGDNEILIPLGSGINFLGYNDFLEVPVGGARLACALVILARSENRNTKLIAAAHAFRGILEMMGNLELFLLVLDVIATVYNIAMKIFPRNQQQNPAPIPNSASQIAALPPNAPAIANVN